MDPDLSLQRRVKTQVFRDQGGLIGFGTSGDMPPMPARRLLRPTPRSVMIFPLVAIVAVLPGMVALNAWDLTPPGPLWGLRGLAVLDGWLFDQVPVAAEIKSTQESAAFRVVAHQPPLYAWLEAIGFWLSANYDPMASVLPSYIAGALVVILVYLHGRLSHGQGVGIVAAVLVGFNQNLLLRMQEATPTTLVICGVLAALLAYRRCQQAVMDSVHSEPWGGVVSWAIVGGLVLGLALLSLTAVALIAVPIVVLHWFYLGKSTTPPSLWRLIRLRQHSGHDRGGTIAALLGLVAASSIALPWFVLMVKSYGWQVIAKLLDPPSGLPVDGDLGLLAHLISLAPATLPLGLLGMVSAIRSALLAESDTRETIGGSFWVIWLGVAALAPAVWRSGPRSAFDLILLVPLNLLAAQTVADLANRRVSVRTLVIVGPATMMAVAWWASANLSDAFEDVIHGRADTATALGLHLMLDLVIGCLVAIRALNQWARHRDDRQRWILSMFIAIVLGVTVMSGLREVVFRHSETHDLLSLRTMILRRNREGPFDVVAVVSPSRSGQYGRNVTQVANRPLPGGRLRFILKTALPRINQRDFASINELINLPEGQRLIVLAGMEQHLSSIDRSRLGVESIHPGRSGVLDVYATVRSRVSRR
jgi:hypothetical protein